MVIVADEYKENSMVITKYAFAQLIGLSFDLFLCVANRS